MTDPEPPDRPGSETQSDAGGNGASPAPQTNGPSGNVAPVRLPAGKAIPRRRRSPPPSGRWWLFAAGGLFLALFAIVVSRGLEGGPTLPPRSLEDQEFIRQANAACARALPALRRDRERRRTGDEGREEALAGTVQRAADDLERLAVEVRGLPVAAADQAEVARWLDDWDAYIATGRRFADALRRGDNKSYAEISAQSTALSERIYGFSKANGIPDCVF